MTSRPSAIRKLHDSVTDPKYDGVRTTRRQLFEDVDAEAHSAPEASSPGGSLPSQSDSEGASGSSQEEEEDDGEGEGESEHAQSDREEQPGRAHIPSDPPRASEMNGGQSTGENEEQHNGDLASALRKTREEDRQKGKAVARQIVRCNFERNRRRKGTRVVTSAVVYTQTAIARPDRVVVRNGQNDVFVHSRALVSVLLLQQEDVAECLRCAMRL